MISRPSGSLWIDPGEPELCKIEAVDKDIDRTNWIILANPIFQAFREKRGLPAIHPLDEAPHPMLPRIISRESHSEAFSHTQGQSRRFAGTLGTSA